MRLKADLRQHAGSGDNAVVPLHHPEQRHLPALIRKQVCPGFPFQHMDHAHAFHIGPVHLFSRNIVPDIRRLRGTLLFIFRQIFPVRNLLQHFCHLLIPSETKTGFRSKQD